MSFQDFLNKYNGQYLEVAGSDARNQCVDLANAYLREVLNHSIVEWTNARDFPSKLTDFDWIQNTPDGVPQEGDIVVWQNNQYGHIAVFIEGNASSFRSFDQNFPTGSPCHVQNHTYINAMCWGRPKANMQAIVDELRTARDNNWTSYQDEIQKNNELKGQLEAEQKKTQELREANATLTKADENLGVELLDAQHKAEALTQDLAFISQTLELPTSDRKTILEAIQRLQTPNEQVVEQVLPILEQFWQNLFKGKKLSLAERIKQLWRGLFS